MKSIFVEIEKCLGCRSCELACAVEHSSSHSLYFAISEQSLPAERIFVERTVFGPFPIQCHHFENALCMEACISGAIQRNKVTDTVYIDKIRCVGCWMCVMVCPFGAIHFDPEKKVFYKCDLCNGDPECIKWCFTKAIEYSEKPDKYIQKKKRKHALKVASVETGRRKAD